MLHGELGAVYDGLPGWLQLATRGLIFLVIAYLVVKVAKMMLFRAIARAPSLDRTLESFLRGLVTGIGWVLILVVTLGGLGVDPVALMGTVAIGGFVIGFALKDTLGNFAAGVMLLVYRPFNVGEAVELKSATGTVTELGMAMTRLKTADGRLVTLPNGIIIGESILNFTRNGTRRVEIDVGIGHGDDVDVAVRASLAAAARDVRILAEPAAAVVVTSLGASSVDLQVRAWVAASDFATVTSDLRVAVKRAIEEAGCSIPFPQRDVHLHQAST